MKFSCDNFTFQGKPESIDIKTKNEGFRVLMKCKGVEFQICNLKGTLDGEIYFYTTKEEVVNNLDRELSIRGVIGTPDDNNNRTLIALVVR